MFHSGWLNKEKPKKKEKADTLIYNPLDISLVENENYSYLNTNRGFLFYHTAQFEKETVINGAIKAHLYIALTTKDTDMEYAIYEVSNNGRTVTKFGGRSNAGKV